ncbi:nucleoside hydrolase [Dictyobacter kobayashii]|uniref:Nucleoside hydrolase n=1 Tax=Dictyobacter kobayashii TaxID=2014872 RepID=A0A402AXY1_9CHLR|nr:nucleoside hydrolase [Dictyobacter kobayashii]GCE23972.1 nucleoside hydrolase [Dictyobacter kobayashii]
MHRIILDTDPGIDDALALFLALASPEIQLEAITTVTGNVDVEHTTHNALALLTLTGRTDIPVARGSREPLVSRRLHATHVHGDHGMGKAQLPPPSIQPVKQHAVDLMIEKIMNNPGEITIVAIGPLTNLALALHREPSIAQTVREVVIMGGALLTPGNVTPSAEFNIYADPHAAHVVFKAGWPIRLVSLDTTNRTPLTQARATALSQGESAVKTCIRQMFAHYFDVYAPLYGVADFHMHDPLCLASVFQPDLITWQPAYVEVELQGALTTGETVAYFKGPQAATPNVQASIAVDAERFIQLFIERVGTTFP